VAGRPTHRPNRLLDVGEIRVEPVVDRRLGGLALDRLALGSVLLGCRGLGLVVGAVGALDGLLELPQRRRDVRAAELLLRRDGAVDPRLCFVIRFGRCAAPLTR
jgi:hypothetical protein